MLQSITLNFTENADPVVLPAQGITIFVGPNNSGKSLVLRELEVALSSNPKPSGLKILSDFEIEWSTEEDVKRDLEALEKKKPLGTPEGYAYIGRFHPGGSFEASNIHLQSLLDFVKAKSNKNWIASQYLRYFIARLDGRTRFDLTNDHSMGDLLGTPQNVLAHLFTDDELRREVRSLIFDAFGLYFVIDPLAGGSLRMRLSPKEPTHDEQSLNSAAREFHGQALYIKDASDGVQAYVGIVTAVLAGQYRAIMIDEPEAFLHPPLARKLGNQLATIAAKHRGSLLASTHSADFLLGCVQASPTAVRVVRMEYSKGKSKGKVVDPAALDKMFRTPLMRSANVISALFHDGVVVTESDNDRVFYSEIYYRLAEQNSGYPSVLFINAQNKQTIADIIGPLREFGIPAAAIADIDILKDGGKVWSAWLSAAQVPTALHPGFSSQRDAVKKCFDNAGKDMKRDGGVDALPASDKSAANQLFDLMDEYGVFAVRRGELEHWLPALGAIGKKTDWTISALEKMGSDPKASGYLKPDKGDVWDFMQKIVAWMMDPSRKGTS